MFLFLIAALPLGLALLVVRIYPSAEGEDTKRAILRGLLASIPIWFLSVFFGTLVPQSVGSPLLAFHDWADRILPWSILPPLAYAVFWHYNEKIPGSRFMRRLTAFHAACLAPFGVWETTRSVLAPDLLTVILLPFIMAAVVLATPLLVRSWLDSTLPNRILLAFGAAAGGLFLSLTRHLLLVRLWYLALVLVALAFYLALRFALPELRERQRKPIVA